MAPTGQTADGTWQLGVRRTIPGMSVQDAWDTALRLIADDVAAGEATSLTDHVVARFPYRVPGDGIDAILQLRVHQAASGATIAIHLERLPDAETRERLLAEWTTAIEALLPD